MPEVDLSTLPPSPSTSLPRRPLPRRSRTRTQSSTSVSAISTKGSQAPVESKSSPPASASQAVHSRLTPKFFNSSVSNVPQVAEEPKPDPQGSFGDLSKLRKSPFRVHSPVEVHRLDSPSASRDEQSRTRSLALLSQRTSHSPPGPHHTCTHSNDASNLEPSMLIHLTTSPSSPSCRSFFAPSISATAPGNLPVGTLLVDYTSSLEAFSEEEETATKDMLLCHSLRTSPLPKARDLVTEVIQRAALVTNASTNGRSTPIPGSASPVSNASSLFGSSPPSSAHANSPSTSETLVPENDCSTSSNGRTVFVSPRTRRPRTPSEYQPSSESDDELLLKSIEASKSTRGSSSSRRSAARSDRSFRKTSSPWSSSHGKSFDPVPAAKRRRVQFLDHVLMPPLPPGHRTSDYRGPGEFGKVVMTRFLGSLPVDDSKDDDYIPPSRVKTSSNKTPKKATSKKASQHAFGSESQAGRVRVSATESEMYPQEIKRTKSRPLGNNSTAVPERQLSNRSIFRNFSPTKSHRASTIVSQSDDRPGSRTTKRAAEYVGRAGAHVSSRTLTDADHAESWHPTTGSDPATRSTGHAPPHFPPFAAAPSGNRSHCTPFASRISPPAVEHSPRVQADEDILDIPSIFPLANDAALYFNLRHLCSFFHVLPRQDLTSRPRRARVHLSNEDERSEYLMGGYLQQIILDDEEHSVSGLSTAANRAHGSPLSTLHSHFSPTPDMTDDSGNDVVAPHQRRVADTREKMARYPYVDIDAVTSECDLSSSEGTAVLCEPEVHNASRPPNYRDALFSAGDTQLLLSSHSPSHSPSVFPVDPIRSLSKLLQPDLFLPAPDDESLGQISPPLPFPSPEHEPQYVPDTVDPSLLGGATHQGVHLLVAADDEEPEAPVASPSHASGPDPSSPPFLPSGLPQRQRSTSGSVARQSRSRSRSLSAFSSFSMRSLAPSDTGDIEESPSAALNKACDYDWPDSPDEIYCHQCRRNRCLIMRYRDTIQFDLVMKFVCPRCQGNCNCTACTDRRNVPYLKPDQFYAVHHITVLKPTRGKKVVASTSTITPPKKKSAAPFHRLTPTRRRPVTHGAATFWGTLYHFDGNHLGAAFERNSNNSVVISRSLSPCSRLSSPQPPSSPRKIRFIGKVQPSWNFGDKPVLKDLYPRVRPLVRPYIGNRANLFLKQTVSRASSLTPLPSDVDDGDKQETMAWWGEEDDEIGSPGGQRRYPSSRKSSVPMEDILRDEHIATANAVQDGINAVWLARAASASRELEAPSQQRQAPITSMQQQQQTFHAIPDSDDEDGGGVSMMDDLAAVLNATFGANAQAVVY
ncbi:hypothetical protein FISHEDRAFT_54809 [Fistulina hepatica ATCC 64428]|uniref:Zinc-finger domain-containing protein n=1 Tax=Fistulina hepatica ATCC 64428 TaxID=1128425 RepID=A0A0D7AQ61_9AGAR|nr:hypothetical protein FISHEDRAFT_54809 [Fistulina hepatica ATCC 64428]